MLARINSNISYLQDSKLDTFGALRRKLRINKKSQIIDINTIIRYYHFKVTTYLASGIYFEDDIFEREDSLRLLKAVSAVSNDKIVVNVSIHSYLKNKHIFDTYNVCPILNLHTLDSHMYHELYGVETNPIEILNHLDYTSEVKIQLTSLNSEEIVSVVHHLLDIGVTPVVCLPQFDSHQEHALNKLTLTINELGSKLSEIANLVSENKIVVIENCPQCMFKDCAFPINMRFVSNYIEDNVLTVEKLTKWNTLLSSRYMKTPQCASCLSKDSCAGINFYLN